MAYGNKPGGYSGSAKWLHWLVAISVIWTIPVGIGMLRVDAGPGQDRLFNFHKSIGLLILIFMILRVANRLINGAPAPEPGLARWQKAVSSAVHGLLYVLLLALPIAGIVANSFYGASLPFFGLFEISPFTPKNVPLAERMFVMHGWVGFAVMVLAAMHIGAALQHAIILRDGVLQRMLPRLLGGK